MARLAVFASGSGSNFEAIARAILKTGHAIEFLLCNVKNAFVLERAKNLGIRSYIVSYKDRERQQVEEEILAHCHKHSVELIALAGFMKLLSGFFLSRFPGTIVNLHPALLPKYPGVDAIRQSFEAGDQTLGISIITIDEGVDTGPVIARASFKRPDSATLEQVEAKIHELEHVHYPRVIIDLLDKIDTGKEA